MAGSGECYIRRWRMAGAGEGKGLENFVLQPLLPLNVRALVDWNRAIMATIDAPPTAV